MKRLTVKQVILSIYIVRILPQVLMVVLLYEILAVTGSCFVRPAAKYRRIWQQVSIYDIMQFVLYTSCKNSCHLIG